MPELEWGHHLLDSLFEFGPALNGPQPVTFQEIESWARATNTRVPGYEALQLRQLSVDYCEQYYKALDSHCPPPGEDHLSRQARVQRQMQEFMRSG